MTPGSDGPAYLAEFRIEHSAKLYTYAMKRIARRFAASRVSEAEWDRLVFGVRPFVAQPEEVDVLNHEDTLQLLRR